MCSRLHNRFLHAIKNLNCVVYTYAILSTQKSRVLLQKTVYDNVQCKMDTFKAIMVSLFSAKLQRFCDISMDKIAENVMWVLPKDSRY